MSIALIIATCLGTGIAIRLLRRLPRLVFAVTSVGSALLILLLATASSQPITVLGRTLALDFAERVFLWPAIGVAAALAFFGPLSFERASDNPREVISNSQGAFFFWSLAPLIVAIALDSFPLAAFFWAIGLMVLVFLAQPRRAGRAGGSAQFLILTVLATASLLLSNRFFDLYPLTPENVGLVSGAFLFLVWGVGLLLAVAPLHVWLGPLAEELSLLGMAFLVGVAQPVGLWLVFQLMMRITWLTEKSPLLSALVLAGAVTVPVGAILTLSERRHGHFLAFISLLPLGHALIGFGMGTRVGLAAAMLTMLDRAVGIALVAGGFAFVRHHVERRWQLIGATAILAGGLALAGMPLTLGSTAQWGLYHELVNLNVPLVGLLVASNAIAFLATVRIASPYLRERDQEIVSPEVKLVPYLCTTVVAILVALIVLIGLFPQILADPLIASLGNAAYLK